MTIEYLTVQHFTAPSGEGVVAQGDHNGWTVEDDLIQNNPDGAGVVIGDNDLVQNNCLQFNGEYGFNGQGNNAVLTHNDINDNNNLHAFDFPGSPANNQCGCSGGGKWWEGLNDQTTDNYVHGNKDVGIWYDTNDAGALISGNYVSDNYSVGIQYEASYNAQITDNTLVGNAIGEGSHQDTPGFPDGAVYISESGGDSRVASNYSGQLLISGNVLTNNWGGVILWENSDRYCSDGSDNACTLINPAIFTESSCAANLSEKSPVDYYDNCRWKTQNVTIKNNTMTFNATTVGSGCSVADLCGFNGLFSNYGTSQYNQTGPIVFKQGNHFSNNTYSGPWHFWAWSQSNLANPVTWAQWTAPVTDQCGTAGEIFEWHLLERVRPGRRKHPGLTRAEGEGTGPALSDVRVSTCRRCVPVATADHTCGDVRPGTTHLLDDNDEVSNRQVAEVERRSGSPRKSTWADIAVPVGLVLLISVPVMMVEEGWHSVPMIDEGNYLWILPAVLVASAFLFGGALAGFRSPSSPVVCVLAVASISLTVSATGRGLSQGLDCSRRDAECRPPPLVPRRHGRARPQRDRIVIRPPACNPPRSTR